MRTGTRMTLAAGWATALAAVPLGAVFTSWQWVWYGWAAVAAVVLSNVLARAARLPGWLVPLVGLLTLLIYLTVVFAGDTALFGVLPTSASLRAVQARVGEGFADVRELAAPVPATPGLVLLAAGSIGALTVLVDTIAVGLRRPAAAGLALLALYAVPTAVARDGVPWPLFVIGTVGYLLLLVVEGRDRVLQWGRPVASRRSGAAGTAAAGRGGWAGSADDDDAGSPLTGQRIGATALAIAVVVPLLVPGLTTNALAQLRGGGGDGGSGTGGGGVGLAPFAALKGKLEQTQPQELLQVRGVDTPFYLRTLVLDRFTANGWRLSNPTGGEQVGGQLGPADGLTRGAVPERQYDARVAVVEYRDKYLPTYYAPLGVQRLPGSWLYDHQTGVIFSPSSSTRRGEYEVVGVQQQPSRGELERVGGLIPAEEGQLGRWTQRPANLPDEVRRTVADVVGGASTPYGKALALNAFFTDGTHGFSYSTQTLLGDSGNDLVDFLRKKQGFCQQYAAAMGVMLREAGVPSRVVLGFQRGTRVTPSDGGESYWSVSTRDAHAWVEAYFSGIGWVPFDPTPRAEGNGVALPYAPHAASPTPGTGTGLSGGTVSGSNGSRGPNNIPQEDRRDPPAAGGRPAPASVRPLTVGVGLGVLALLALLAAPGAGRALSRRRRLRTAAGGDAAAAAGAAWDEVVASAVDGGVSAGPNETPRGLVLRWIRELPLSGDGASGLRLVALAEERARYAPVAGVPGDLPGATRVASRELRQLGPRRRWWVLLLPSSTVRAARSGAASRSGRATAAVDGLVEGLRAAVPGRLPGGPRRPGGRTPAGG